MRIRRPSGRLAMSRIFLGIAFCFLLFLQGGNSSFAYSEDHLIIHGYYYDQSLSKFIDTNAPFANGTSWEEIKKTFPSMIYAKVGASGEETLPITVEWEEPEGFVPSNPYTYKVFARLSVADSEEDGLSEEFPPFYINVTILAPAQESELKTPSVSEKKEASFSTILNRFMNGQKDVKGLWYKFLGLSGFSYSKTSISGNYSEGYGSISGLLKRYENRNLASSQH